MTVVRVADYDAARATATISKTNTASGSIVTSPFFTLEVLGDGPEFNNFCGTGSSFGTDELLPPRAHAKAANNHFGSGSFGGTVNNFRWEITSRNLKKGTFSLVIRQGNDTIKRKQVEQVRADVIAAEKQYEFAKKSAEALQESFTYNEQKFNEGMLNVYDYNDAKNKLIKAESDLLQAKYDYLFKIKILDFFMGKPLTL